ncbi:MAG TPA: phytanoyl-CoA dioxygenase family protein, partial [Abditibacteriaceae bacterium]|nr:phytanoyl-CoA dioxygenase family protein [Abditibacteriaceae bacterium]
MLSEQQVLQFQTFGFLILRQLFTPAELEIINLEFDRQLEAEYRHSPFNGTKRHWVTMMGPQTPFFASLLEDRRFHGAARQLYGDVFGTITDANRYVGDSAWHPDTASIHQYGVKFAYYLDPVGAASGALRVIPGSHKNPLHTDLLENLGGLGLDIGQIPG